MGARLSGAADDPRPESAVLDAAGGWRVRGGPERSLWASCTGGTEALAAEELAALGWRVDTPDGAQSPADDRAAAGLETGRGAVHGRADLATVYRTLLGARTVDRVSLLLARAEVNDLDEVAEVVAELDLGGLPPLPFAVRARRVGAHPFGSPDLAGAVGAAVIAAHRRATGRRLPVDLEDPATVVRAELRGTRLRLGLELTDGALHRRGWRVAPHRAGLRPTLAAGLLLLARWRADERLLDPVAGGGTIPIEAAQAALRRRPRAAPPRRLAHLPLADPELASSVAAELDQRRRDRLPGRVVGWDRSGRSLALARANRRASGLIRSVELERRDLRRPADLGEVDCVVANPPYGVRVGRPDALRALYATLLGRVACRLADGGRVVVLAPSAGLVERATRGTGLRLVHSRTVSRGSFDVAACRLAPC